MLCNLLCIYAHQVAFKVFLLMYVNFNYNFPARMIVYYHFQAGKGVKFQTGLAIDFLAL